MPHTHKKVLQRLHFYNNTCCVLLLINTSCPFPSFFRRSQAPQGSTNHNKWDRDSLTRKNFKSYPMPIYGWVRDNPTPTHLLVGPGGRAPRLIELAWALQTQDDGEERRKRGLRFWWLVWTLFLAWFNNLIQVTGLGLINYWEGLRYSRVRPRSVL